MRLGNKGFEMGPSVLAHVCSEVQSHKSISFTPDLEICRLKNTYHLHDQQKFKTYNREIVSLRKAVSFNRMDRV